MIGISETRMKEEEETSRTWRLDDVWEELSEIMRKNETRDSMKENVDKKTDKKIEDDDDERVQRLGSQLDGLDLSGHSNVL